MPSSIYWQYQLVVHVVSRQRSHPKDQGLPLWRAAVSLEIFAVSL